MASYHAAFIPPPPPPSYTETVKSSPLASPTSARPGDFPTFGVPAGARAPLSPVRGPPPPSYSASVAVAPPPYSSPTSQGVPYTSAAAAPGLGTPSRGLSRNASPMVSTPTTPRGESPSIVKSSERFRHDPYSATAAQVATD